MQEEDLTLFTHTDKVEILGELLQTFLKKNESVFTFPDLSKNNSRSLLWSALFQHLQNPSLTSIHSSCLAAIRILSRDKTDLENLICEKWITVLIEKAGLYQIEDTKQKNLETIPLSQREIIVEALKCLCNLAFNSDVTRALCASSSIAEGLVSRVIFYKEITFKDDIMLFDMKLVFILTALRQDIKVKIKDGLNGMKHLTNCLNDLIIQSGSDNEQWSINNNVQAIMCQVLKTQFNLLLKQETEENISYSEESMYLEIIQVLNKLLEARCVSDDKVMELRSDVANLLTSVPLTFYSHLTPEIKEAQNVINSFLGRNMNSLQALVDLLHYRLTVSEDTRNQYENLSPILTVLNKSSCSCREHRKYLRQVVLPPLRDVSKPPEKGRTIRNQLCRLLTSPVTPVRDLVAEFLFVLCKEKVGRMVKYTGFGNAAGHLAQKGLLGGGQGAFYSSSSDDSDTEEYIQAQPHIDPVVGCTRPPRVNPFEGMSEEQKEYEAMKLVNLFDKMVSDGVVKPACIGPDGRPQPVEHVLELRENPPNRPQS